MWNILQMLTSSGNFSEIHRVVLQDLHQDKCWCIVLSLYILVGPIPVSCLACPGIFISYRSWQILDKQRSDHLASNTDRLCSFQTSSWLRKQSFFLVGISYPSSSYVSLLGRWDRKIVRLMHQFCISLHLPAMCEMRIWSNFLLLTVALRWMKCRACYTF